MKKVNNKNENLISKTKKYFEENERRTIVLIIVIHLLLLFLFRQSFSSNYPLISNYGSPDANNYVKMAYQLIDEGVYAYKSTESNAYVTPSQPIYVASILLLNKVIKVNDLALLQFFNLLFSIGSIILIYKISFKLFKKKKYSFIAALLFATYFPNIYYIRAVLTEIPTIFFMMLSIYIFIKAFEKDDKKLYVLFSILYAITIMFRPALAPLLLISVYLLIKKYGIKGALLRCLNFSVGFFLIIFPWILRNYIQFGQLYIFSSHGGNPLLGGAEPFYINDINYVEKANLGMTDSEYAKYIIIRGFKADPKLYISWFTMGKFLWLYAGPSKWLYYSSQYSLFTPFAYLHHMLILIPALYAIIVLRKKNKKIKYLSIIPILYTLIQMSFIAVDRFGYLMFPIFSILAAYSIPHIIEKLKIYFDLIRNNTKKYISKQQQTI